MSLEPHSPVYCFLDETQSPIHAKRTGQENPTEGFMAVIHLRFVPSPWE